MIRDLARRSQDRGPVAGSAALMMSLFTVPAVSAPIIYAWTVYPGDTMMDGLIWWLAIAFIPTPIYVIDFLWRSELRPAYSVLPRLLIMPLALIAKAVAASAGYSIIAIAAITAFEACAIFPRVWLRSSMFLKERPNEHWGLDRKVLGVLFRQTLPAMVAWLIGFIFSASRISCAGISLSGLRAGRHLFGGLTS